MLDDPPTAAELTEDLQSVLLWNPQPALFQPSRRKEHPPPLVLPAHIAYNRHLDAKLGLRRVVPLGSLVNDISDVPQANIDSLLSTGICDQLPSSALKQFLRLHPDPGVRSAEVIANHYSNSFAKICSCIVTKLLIPKLPLWEDSIHWHRRALADTTPTGVNDNSRLYFFQHDDGRIKLFDDHDTLIDKDTLKDLDRVGHHEKPFGAWIFLSCSTEAQNLLESLDVYFSRETFKYRVCRTAYPTDTTSNIDIPRDSPSPAWKLPPSLVVPEEPLLHTPRRSARSAARKAVDFRVVPSARHRPRTTAHALPVTAEELIQLAWARAVETDSSIIVFNCGHFERICVRHRETQTLYMSPMYNVSTCERGYIRLHVGLYLALLRDEIERFKALENRISNPVHNTTKPHKNPRKRSAPEDAVGPAVKRAKMSSKKRAEATTPESPMELASQRDMMMVHLQFGVYHSPVPASFIRANLCLVHKSKRKSKIALKRSYQPYELIELTLTERLGGGATGVAHGAVARMATKDGQTFVQDNLVVKLAFREVPQRRLRHEYDVYRRLAEHAVTGVPKVYGLFEDLEGGTIALLMSNCGTTLWNLRPNKKDLAIFVPQAQRERFAEILSNVHKAGVRHYDIRSDNLMVNDAGEAFIVDFDRGRFNPSEGKKKREMGILEELMAGHDHYFGVRSPRCTGDSAEIWTRTPPPSEHHSQSSDEEQEEDRGSQDEEAGGEVDDC
uniref:Protein kinase domain-containing protein n=1 Tax=Mycena chlorophos TaxID=658473 RepID=A0ABQ0LRS8_MYCCL|nr:predicted protein [Mycena chlorophos]